MGLMDKLKNIFFEEDDEDEDEIDDTEYQASKEEQGEEEFEKNKEKEKEKINIKDKFKEIVKDRKNDDNLEKKEEVIARKVEIPKNNEIKREKKEEEIIGPPEDTIKEIKKEIKKEVVVKQQPKVNPELIFDDDDFIFEPPKVKKESAVKSTPTSLYNKKETETKKKAEVKNDYSKSAYQTKDEPKEKTFKPSPIISPIYGILDKNYRKEEVKENKEIRLSSRPSKMDLDSVRNKAFGDLEYDLMGDFSDDIKDSVGKEEKKVKEETKSSPEFSRSELKKLYNAKKGDEEKPTIEKVTIGEADEYFNDLGLAYNTDYKDLSKDVSDGKIIPKSNEDNLEDNLFDLIESMYDKEE